MSRLVCVPIDSQARSTPRPMPGETVILALDVSRAKWVYCLRWGGQLQRQLSTPGELPHLQALIGQYRDCHLQVVYEACGFGYAIAWWLQEQGIEVTVIAPCQVERAPGRRVKTDRLDAAALAYKRETGQLKAIYIPPRALHAHRQVARTYGQALKDRRRQQTRVRSLLQEHGRLGPSPGQGWRAYASWLQQQTLPPPLARCVAELLELRRSADASAQRLKAQLLAYAEMPAFAPVATALAAQPGIGSFSAIRLTLELGDIRRFARGKALVRYLGLAPNEYSSGEMVHRGHILKCGPAAVRSLLVQCAWRSIRADHGDPALRRFYQRLRPRLQSKRAIIAVTRRLALAVYTRWSAAVAQAAATA